MRACSVLRLAGRLAKTAPRMCMYLQPWCGVPNTATTQNIIQKHRHPFREARIRQTGRKHGCMHLSHHNSRCPACTTYHGATQWGHASTPSWRPHLVMSVHEALQQPSELVKPAHCSPLHIAHGSLLAESPPETADQCSSGMPSARPCCAHAAAHRTTAAGLPGSEGCRARAAHRQVPPLLP